ncbi:MAG: hypothetical protein QGH73_05445 [Rhodospirillales bacterium]|jgi:hypothetical protein|nr:hypothetical protein [Rhodospirillaceae bacterium]MDP6428811.1 hypothetical protein [Rhodospirillales bacterium]MDP6643998.1 hypothetical protein [Rhodospirillales bacterium]MDP6841103.1 hypothetical protein [Rhodospirillales bacterium]|tara:strand:- start:701 stop:1093 length:393 start_codon:yes stop_codon:yes gene_type:complete
MKKTTLINLGGAVLGIGVAVLLLGDNAPFADKKFQSVAHGAYVDCLMQGYEKGGAKEWRLLLKSYRGCKGAEAAYKSDLKSRRVLPEKKVMRHIERLNEAAIARHLGVTPEATKGWGCLTPKKKPERLVS